ncbi:MAG: RsmD family RNA methyltransferase [Lewinellaceae bacterium]|nr:RsmD family RNA methyltransferase [Saprospiraceae bacterium]MCB9333249.1 RsmD family RNA methyltransferase [Lewinellaceae bacterium]
MLTPADRQFIQDHLQDDLHRLLLSASRYPDVQVPVAVAQIEAFRKIREKVPSWFRFDLIMPPVRSVEQASSEETARFKTGLFSGNSMADLTGGMGIDSWFFSRQFNQVVYVEQQPQLVENARHNFDVLEARNINVLAADSAFFLKQTDLHFDLIYLDPGRRHELKGKVFQLADCAPNILEIKTELLNTSDRVLLKTAPMLDIFQAVEQIGLVSRIWVVSVAGECKEVLYLLEKKAPATDEIPIEVVCLGGGAPGFQFTRAEEQAAQPAFSMPQQFVYEPDAAVLKAGAFKSFAMRFGLAKLHPNTHLYTSQTLVPNVPGRAFHVEAVLKYDRKALHEVLPDGQANLATRNFPDSVVQMRKKLGVRDGGDYYVFGVTDYTDRKILLLCRRVLDKTT